MKNSNDSTAPVIVMLSRAPQGSVIRVSDAVLNHTTSCASFSGRSDLIILSFKQFEAAFLLNLSEDGRSWQVAYPSGRNSENLCVPWIDMREEQFALREVPREFLQDTVGMTLVWSFHESPEQFKRSLGGDENWLAILPIANENVEGRERYFWLDEWFGCCDVDFQALDECHTIAIGAH